MKQRKGKSSVEKTLSESPGSFAFAQAVEIMKAGLRARGVDDVDKAIRFCVNPNLSFPPSDIEKIAFIEKDKRVFVEMTMNLMGLHGAGSPLPAYFTEHVAQNQDGEDHVRELFNFYNHFLVKILYTVWRRYRYYLQYQPGATDRFSQRFFGIIGMGYAHLRDAKNLDWERLFAYMGLIAFKSDAGGSLESILRHYFSHQSVYVIPCIQRTVDIPKRQRSRLGFVNSGLGSSFVLGEQVQDQTGKFRIQVSDLSWGQFTSFLPDSRVFRELTALVKATLRSRLQFDLELRLRLEEVRQFQIGGNSETRLGWSTWIGDSGDGIVGLEPSEREFISI